MTLLRMAASLLIISGHICRLIKPTSSRGTDHKNDMIDTLLLMAEPLPFNAS